MTYHLITLNSIFCVIFAIRLSVFQLQVVSDFVK